jgi:hypothetical protein
MALYNRKSKDSSFTKRVTILLTDKDFNLFNRFARAFRLPHGQLGRDWITKILRSEDNITKLERQEQINRYQSTKRALGMS